MRRNPSALVGREFDLVVVGGGICGAAAAWDATQRGLSVALLERGDFGAETSANSLKVVHGGIRYLQHLDLPRVRESAGERSALLRIAPHLVHPLPVLVPTFGHAMRGAEALGAAFVLLNALTATRNRGIPDPERRIPNARLVSRSTVQAWHPELVVPGLTGAGLFWDGQLYNPPRLVWEFVRTAMLAGATAANYCEVVEFLRRDRRVVGVAVSDRLTGERFDVRARVVLNAAGPFAGLLRVRGGQQAADRIPLSRDMAVVIRRPLIREHALAVQTKYRDPDAFLSRGPRHLFVVPWRDVTLVGVNSIVYRDNPNGLTVTEAEVQGFLDEINEAEPRFAVTPDDVGLVLAGLLPIGAEGLVESNVSFGKRALVVDNAKADGVDGLVTAVSNRYTTARRVGERAVDLAFRKLGVTPPPSRSAVTPLHGGNVPSFAGLVREIAQEGGGQGFAPGVAEQLAHNHGSAYGEVLRLARRGPGHGATLGRTSTLAAQVVHAVRAEMAQHLADCVFRRTDIGTAGDPGEEALAGCAALMAEELGWSGTKTETELAEVRSRFRTGFTLSSPPAC
ncbi:MAG TPA: glycerol-3-phosphate dehydrogenase/oxidase [Gemmatimonadales bacterium]|nr:glycerol-3-phosphate dehydrogenase/oxidase [Gemmatimonadales bacterium]